jgi:hypothetical protein
MSCYTTDVKYYPSQWVNDQHYRSLIYRPYYYTYFDYPYYESKYYSKYNKKYSPPHHAFHKTVLDDGTLIENFGSSYGNIYLIFIFIFILLFIAI